MIKRTLLMLVALVVVALAGLYLFATRHDAIAAIEPPAPGSFDPALVERGGMLAGFGNCAVCHTAPGGQPFAGGLALPTPFGVIHTTNITPDRSS